MTARALAFLTLCDAHPVGQAALLVDALLGLAHWMVSPVNTFQELLPSCSEYLNRCRSGTDGAAAGQTGVANVTVVRERQSNARFPLAEGETLLEGLLRNGVALAHECGGTLACASCCVVVLQGLESLSPTSEDEQDMLERADARAPGARLSCQVLVGSDELTVEIPRGSAAHSVFPPPSTAQPLSGGLPVSLSERAARHLAGQLAKRPGAAAVRLSVEPAGCSGFRYCLDHADAIRDDDTVFESFGVRVAVDPKSLPQVHGTTLDLVDEGLARRLRFDNPNVRQTCGCGESFGT